MKINAAQGQVKSKISPKEELRAKLAEKFGDKFKAKAEIDKEKQQAKAAEVEISDSAKKKAHIDPEGFGDVKNNDPNSEETKIKLKALLQTGGFNFSDKERGALSEILK